MMTPSPSQYRLTLALLVLATMLWGLTFLFAKVITQTTDTFTYMAARFAIAAGLMLLLYGRRVGGMSGREALQGLWVGLFMFGAVVLMTEGVKETTASVAGFLTALYVVFVPFVAWAWIGEALRPLMLLASGVAFLGLFVMTADGGFSLSFSRGEWLLLAGAFLGALHIVAVSRYARSMDSMRLTFLQLLAVALYSLVAMPISGSSLHISPDVWLKIMLMALFMTVVTFSIMTQAQRILSSTQATLVYALEPVWAALFGVLAGERLSMQHGWGGLLIVLALLVGSLPSDWATLARHRIGQFFAARSLRRQAVVVRPSASPER